MNTDHNTKPAKHRFRNQHSDKGHLWFGGALLIAGALWLAREAGVNFPHWFFSWPMAVIAIGLFTGIRHRFSNPVPFILLLVGGIFLFDRISDDFSLSQFAWPIILIALGLLFIIRPKGGSCGYNRKYTEERDGAHLSTQEGDNWERTMASGEDLIDVTAIFGGVKKNILTKNLKGGEIVTIMGGAEINLMQSDFKGKVIVENLNMFGGTKLLVPPDWDVQSQIVAIFGGVDDKRPPASHTDPDKVLFLEGTCIFGGVEIRSF